jgi:hypothetical protein
MLGCIFAGILVASIVIASIENQWEIATIAAKAFALLSSLFSLIFHSIHMHYRMMY